VVLDGTVGGLVDVLYGVRQGSILGPLLFIILTSGMANFFWVREDETIVYADDSNVWQTGSNGEEVARKLAEKEALFVEYTRTMGLSMNAAKTQLLFSSRAGNVADTIVELDGSVIYPNGVIELLGVKYDRKLSTAPHVKALLADVRQRASVISRLANHLPRGEYLRQLSYKLVIGKFSHALAAVARPRLESEDNASVIWSGIQVAFNQVARSITGARRRDHVKTEDLLAQAGLERKQDGGQGRRGRKVELFPQRRREGWRQEPRREDPLLGQEDGHGEDYAVGKDRADRGPSVGG
jgi:hypothetical protein